MLRVRRATLQDLASIQAIYRSFSDGRIDASEEQLERLINRGGILVAEQHGRVIGFGGIDLDSKEQIKHLYVLEDQQQSGVGKQLLNKLEEAGWESGLRLLRLHSSPGAVEFYKRSGYTPVPQSEKFGHDHAGVEMVKLRDGTQ